MAVPYTEVFVGLLLAYMAYSVWARLDGRYPIGAALALLVVTAIVDATGDTAAADTLAEFVFFLLGAGVVLLLIEHLRERSEAPVAATAVGSPSERVPTEAPEEGKRSTEQLLDGLEKESVAVVDRPGDENGEHEPQDDSQG